MTDTALVQSKTEIMTAQAAQAQALVLARYTMAERHPRNWKNVRIKLLAACERPVFAESARFKIPFRERALDPETGQWGWVDKPVRGYSIRFAEEAHRTMGNLDAATMAIYDDEEKCVIQTTVTDLETNSTWSTMATIEKVNERKYPKKDEKQQVIKWLRSRQNSKGETVYLYRATEHDVAKMVGAARSKLVRNGILHFIPSDIKEECETRILETLTKEDKTDPAAQVKRICDKLARFGVMPSDVEELLGHPLEGVTPRELEDLRGYYTALDEGLASWPEIVEVASTKAPAKDDPLAETRKAVQDAVAKSKGKVAKASTRRKKETDEPPKAPDDVERDPNTGEAIPDGVGVREPGAEG